MNAIIAYVVVDLKVAVEGGRSEERKLSPNEETSACGCIKYASLTLSYKKKTENSPMDMKTSGTLLKKLYGLKVPQVMFIERFLFRPLTCS